MLRRPRSGAKIVWMHFTLPGLLRRRFKRASLQWTFPLTSAFYTVRYIHSLDFIAYNVKIPEGYTHLSVPSIKFLHRRPSVMRHYIVRTTFRTCSRASFLVQNTFWISAAEGRRMEWSDISSAPFCSVPVGVVMGMLRVPASSDSTPPPSSMFEATVWSCWGGSEWWGGRILPFVYCSLLGLGLGLVCKSSDNIMEREKG